MVPIMNEQRESRSNRLRNAASSHMFGRFVNGRDRERHELEFKILREFLSDRNRALLEARSSLIDLERKTAQILDVETTALLENPVALSRLAVTDLFVEKAQRVLTRRATVMRRAGQMCFAVALVVLSFAAYLAWEATSRPVSDPTTNELILLIARALILGGYLIIALRMTIALGRSFLHEATALLNRRHAMRLGRMVAHRLPFENLLVDDLAAAFDWNMDSDSSFRDIDPNKVTETLLGNLLNLKSVADAVKDVK